MNAEKLSKPYRSCRYLETEISFLDQDIGFCPERPSPVYIQPMADVSKTVDAFLEARDRMIRENQGTNPPCAGCNLFQESGPTNGEIKNISFATHNFCNFSCIYCDLEKTKAQYKNKAEAYDSLEIAQELKRRGLLSNTLKVSCSPGEITVHPQRDKYYDFIEENASFVFFVSNAGRFDSRLAHILSLSPRNGMLVSIDCGTEETFRRIRGVDMFRQVIDNLTQYRKYSSQILLKYIIIDENCGDKDLNNFIRICGDLKVSQMIVSGDRMTAWDREKQLSYQENIVSAAIKLVQGAIRSNLYFTLWEDLGEANLREIYRRLVKIPEIVSAEQQLDTILSASKVVCYGAGGNCENILDQIKELGLRKPDVIWDMKAEPGQKFHAAGCEYPVCQPDFDSLDGSMKIGVFTTITNSTTNQKLAQDMKEHGFSNLLTHDRLFLAFMAKRAKMPIEIGVINNNGSSGKK